MYNAPSKCDTYDVGGVLTPNRFDLFTAKAVPTGPKNGRLRFAVGVTFIYRKSITHQQLLRGWFAVRLSGCVA